LHADDLIVGLAFALTMLMLAGPIHLGYLIAEMVACGSLPSAVIAAGAQCMAQSPLSAISLCASLNVTQIVAYGTKLCPNVAFGSMSSTTAWYAAFFIIAVVWTVLPIPMLVMCRRLYRLSPLIRMGDQLRGLAELSSVADLPDGIQRMLSVNGQPTPARSITQSNVSDIPLPVRVNTFVQQQQQRYAHPTTFSSPSV
jgi:hypothetical protein